MKKENNMSIEDIVISLAELGIGIVVIIVGIATIVEMICHKCYFEPTLREGIGYIFIGLIILRHVIKNPENDWMETFEEKESV